jgi:hypothetical protein
MKTYIILFMMFCVKTSFALDIENITITPINSNDINIHLKTINSSGFMYLSNNYNIVGSIITLKVCYFQFLTGVIQQDEKDITIPLLNSITTNYTLIVNVYWEDNVAPVACNYTSFQDTETLQFSTPLTQPVYLGNSIFEKVKGFKIFPNPVKNVFKINSNLIEYISKIEIYNTLGQLVQTITNPSTANDVSGLKTGTYFVKMVTDKGVTSSKFVKE